MSFQQKIISLIVALFIFIAVIELLRKKKLIEEFTWIWLGAGISILIIVVWEKFLFFITKMTGIIAPTSIVFFFGIIVLLLIDLQLSIFLSRNTILLKNAIQKISIYEHDIDQIKGELEELKKNKTE